MLKEIAEHRGIELIEIHPGDEYCKANGEETYINRSYISGKTIELGIYEDPEKKIASFFHEIGHTMTPHRFRKKISKRVEEIIPYRQYDFEKAAWKYGYKLAKFYGIEFSKDTKKWANAQLESYKGWEERERTKT